MEERHKCPVCGKYEFDEDNSFDVCEVCGWVDDALYEQDPDKSPGGVFKMSLNEARQAYQNGRPME